MGFGRYRSLMADSSGRQERPEDPDSTVEFPEPGYVAGKGVDLDVDEVARGDVVPGGGRTGMRDEVDAEPAPLDLVHRERRAVEGDRSLGGDEAGERVGGAEGDAQAVALRPERLDPGRAVDMAGDDMPAELVPDPERAFEVDAPSGSPCGTPVAKVGLRHRLRRD